MTSRPTTTSVPQVGGLSEIELVDMPPNDSDADVLRARAAARNPSHAVRSDRVTSGQDGSVHSSQAGSFRAETFNGSSNSLARAAGSVGGSADGSGRVKSRGGARGHGSHAEGELGHAPSNRRDQEASGARGGLQGEKPKDADSYHRGGGNRGGGHDVRQTGGRPDNSRHGEDKSRRLDRSTQGSSRKLVDRSTRDRLGSVGSENIDASTKSVGKRGLAERAASAMNVLSVFSHPKDPRRSTPQERPKPNENERKLLDAANVSHDFFVSFSEVKWVANLSEGDMGEVHRVRWRGVDCAAKTSKGIGNQMAKKDSQLYMDMLKEIYIMSRLGYHPNVVGFFGVSMGPGQNPMILIELINGPTLDHFLASMEGMLGHWRKQRPTVVAWAKGLFKGMDFLHSREPIILHRDIKPGNLLLSEGLRTLKIADFGVSRILKRQDRLKRSLTGMTGTRRYMAPEVYGRKQGIYTEKADIYSCSLVVWEMAMGLKPFSDVAPAELAQPKVREWLRPPTDIIEWRELAALIEKGWDRDHEKRPTALQMYEELVSLNGVPDPGIDVSPMRGNMPDTGISLDMCLACC